MNETILKIKKRHPNAKIPKYQTIGSSGMDVEACLDAPYNLYKGCTAIINTGLEFEIPEGYEIQVRPRSGLAAKYQITVLNSPGTVDQDFSGIVKVILINLGPQTFVIENGMRIAQLVLAPIAKAKIEVVEETTETSRGECGFGSTGVK